jgi:predicted permease
MILHRIWEWVVRLRFFVGRSPRSDRANLEEELRFHLERSIEEKLAHGMRLEEARRQTRIEFGGVEHAREETWRQRPGWLLDTVAQDVRYALRGFRRNPVFVVTVVVTLALGIGATTAVFSVVDRILLRSLPYAQDSRLVSIGLVQSLEKQEFTLGGFFFEWRDNQKPFSSLTYERGVHDCNVTDSNPQHLQCAEVAQSFLPALGVAMTLGRNFLPEEDLPNGPRVALISDGLWLSRFHRDPGILNRIVSIDEHPTRIAGVLPADFEMPRLQTADILLPAQMDEGAQHTVNSGIGYPMWAFARLKPGVSPSQARSEMEPLYRHTQQWIPAEIRKDFHLQIRSIRDRQMQDAYQSAWLLLGGVVAVLLIACANVASLFSARGGARQRELAVRAALGASRGRLMRQTMTEASLLAAAAAIVGCLLAELLLRTFLAIAPAGIPFLAKARLDLRVIAFALLVSLLCAVCFGMLAAQEKPRTEALASKSAQSVARARLRRLLVAGQIAVSMVLLASAGLLLRSFWNLERQNLGIETRHVLTVHVPLNWEHYSGSGRMEFYLHAEAALRSLPGVSAVGMSNSLPPDGDSWHGGMRYADLLAMGKPPHTAGIGGTVVTRVVTPGYFRVLGIPVLEGTGFTEQQRTTPGEFLVLSKLLASRLFPGEDPLGKRIQFGEFRPYFVANPTVYTVAGVVADVKNAGLTGQPEPELYSLRTSRDPDSWDNHHYFLIESSLPEAVIAPWIRTRIAQLDPTAPIDIESLAEQVNRLGDRPRFETSLIGFFALCGLLMAIIGLYGVIAYVASQRTQEIGIRMALGANRGDILRLIASEGLRMIVFGGAAGLLVALAVSRLIQSLLFEVTPHDPATLGAVAALLAVVALAATLIPARNAMRVDPVQALRAE